MSGERPKPHFLATSRAQCLLYSGIAIAALYAVCFLVYSHRAPTTKNTLSGACEQTYRKFFAKDSLNFTIVFGYKDARPARYVGDRYERAYFIQKLLTYGFRRDPDRSLEHEDQFLFRTVGPDERIKSITLTLVDSSAGPDDQENREDPFQKWKSAHAEAVFLRALKTADLIFYYGHSRDGGGPDFTPPPLLLNQHVDYDWYIRNRPGLKKMQQALKDSKTSRCALGLYSCVSDKLFANAIRSIKPNVSLMTSSELLYYQDALSGMLETLAGILEKKCRAEFAPTGTQISNFFLDENPSENLPTVISIHQTQKTSGHVPKKRHRGRPER